MSFSKAVLALSMFVMLCLTGCYLIQEEGLGGSPNEKKQPPELPLEFRENLSRVTPKGTRIQSYRRTRTESGFQFEVDAETSLGPMRIWMNQKGLPLKMAETPKPEDIPASLVEGLGQQEIRDQVQRQWLLLYEIETKQEGGKELETFVDGRGTVRFSMVETEEEAEEKTTWEALPQRAKTNLARFFTGRRPASIFREREWGRVFFEVTWRSDFGIQEIKCFETGQVFLWEMPPDFPIAKSIRPHLQDDPPEALFMALYCRLDENGETCVLADGTPFPEGLKNKVCIANLHTGVFLIRFFLTESASCESGFWFTKGVASFRIQWVRCLEPAVFGSPPSDQIRVERGVIFVLGPFKLETPGLALPS